MAACMQGDVTAAKCLYQHDPDIVNQTDLRGGTGLMRALWRGRYPISRWILSLPELDTTICNSFDLTTLHFASDAPLDILIHVAKITDRETLNKKDRNGKTALDHALYFENTSSILYLTWLGVDCRGEYRYKEISWDTWVEAAITDNSVLYDSQYWAVASGQRLTLMKLISTLRSLDQLNMLDRENLRSLAKLFKRESICGMWGDLSSLGSLTWEEVRQSSPALASLPPATLLQHQVPGHVVKLLIDYGQQ